MPAQVSPKKPVATTDDASNGAILAVDATPATDLAYFDGPLTPAMRSDGLKSFGLQSFEAITPGVSVSLNPTQRTICREMFRLLGGTDDVRIGPRQCGVALAMFTSEAPPLLGLNWARVEQKPAGQAIKSVQLARSLREGQTSFTPAEMTKFGANGMRWARLDQAPADKEARPLKNVPALVHTLEAGQLEYTADELTLLLGARASSLDVDCYVEVGEQCFAPLPSGLKSLSEQAYIAVSTYEHLSFYRPETEVKEHLRLVGSESLDKDEFTQLVTLVLQRGAATQKTQEDQTALVDRMLGEARRWLRTIKKAFDSIDGIEGSTADGELSPQEFRVGAQMFGLRRNAESILFGAAGGQSKGKKKGKAAKRSEPTLDEDVDAAFAAADEDGSNALDFPEFAFLLARSLRADHSESHLDETLRRFYTLRVLLRPLRYLGCAKIRVAMVAAWLSWRR